MRWLLLLGLLTACSSSNSPPVGALRATPAPAAIIPTAYIAPSARLFDRQFIDAMAPHDQLEIELARIALVRAEHQELRDLAQEMVDTETVEVRDMHAWRQAWFGSSLTPPISSAEIDALRVAPEPFDRAFIDTLLPFQQQALDLAQRALREAGHQDVLDLAGAIYESHTRQSAQMRAWRSQW